MTLPTPPRRDAEEQARLDGELTALIEQRITFNQVLGLRVQALLPTCCCASTCGPSWWAISTMAACTAG